VFITNLNVVVVGQVL